MKNNNFHKKRILILLKKTLALAGLTLSINANAAIVELTWDTELTNTSVYGTSESDQVSLTFRFETASSDLSALTLNQTNFMDYSFHISGGRYMTLDLEQGGYIAVSYTHLTLPTKA